MYIIEQYILQSNESWNPDYSVWEPIRFIRTYGSIYHFSYSMVASLIGHIILLPPEVALWLATKILFPAEVILCSQSEYQKYEKWHLSEMNLIKFILITSFNENVFIFQTNGTDGNGRSGWCNCVDRSYRRISRIQFETCSTWSPARHLFDRACSHAWKCPRINVNLRFVWTVSILVLTNITSYNRGLKIVMCIY